MKRLLILALLAASCAQQDAAALVTMAGPFRIPADADKLTIDVYDGSQSILHKVWCTTNTAIGCSSAGNLPPQTTLSSSLTLVQSGASHPKIKVNVQLSLGTTVVGIGTSLVEFESGKTVDVSIPLTNAP